MPLPVPVSPAALEELAAKYGTPFQLYDEGAIRDNCRALLASFSKHFPGFRQFYAVKALPNPAILKLLIDEGCGLDCSSVSELHIAKELGVPGNAVMYTSNYTSAKDLGIAFDQGVIINLDDASLVDTLVEARGRCPDLICFRLNPGLGRTDSETASNVLGGPDAKFGVPPEAIVGAYRAAKAAGATRFGMHMMTGSCVLNDAYWQDTVTVLVDTVARVSREVGIEQWEFLNIGGGLGIPYRPGQPRVEVEGLTAQMAATIASRWTAAGLPGSPPRLFMENGRYMTGPYGWLVSRCEAVKKAFGTTYYGLDACMANLMRPGMYGSYHHVTVPAKEGGEGSARATANVVGTLCENNDWFAKARDLPSTASSGDLFVIHDTGAHSHSMGFQYNGKLRAPELLVRAAPAAGAGAAAQPQRIELIRERETIPGLFANCRMPADLLAKGLPAGYAYAAGSAAPAAASAAAPAAAAAKAGRSGGAAHVALMVAAGAGLVALGVALGPKLQQLKLAASSRA